MIIFEKKNLSIGIYFWYLYFRQATSLFGGGGAKEKLPKGVSIRPLETEHLNFLASNMIII